MLSMIGYHACWDLVNIYGKNWAWYQSENAYIWQQSICWTFILLSGFCWSMGKHPFKRGLIVFGAGAVVSVVTIVWMPENKVEFGVLTCIGSCMLIVFLLEKGLRRISNLWGFIGSVALFILTRNINIGYLGFEDWNLVKIPETLYQGKIMTFLGFMDPGFYSTDYFSLMPWLFLFLAGYFFYQVLKKNMSVKLWNKLFTKGCKPLSAMGRNSLIIYMVHQPLIYAIFYLLNRWNLL